MAPPREWALWADIGYLVGVIDRERATKAPTVPDLPALPPAAAPRRVETSDSTQAWTTPATAVPTVQSPAPLPPDPGDQFAYPPEVDADGTTIGWNACLVAAEVKVAAAIAVVIKNGGTVVEARTQTLIALRAMRRG